MAVTKSVAHLAGLGLLAIGCAVVTVAAQATQPKPKPLAIEHWRGSSDTWFATAEGRQIIANIISWQEANGGWHKSYDTTVPRSQAKREADGGAGPPSDGVSVWQQASTIDNDATYTELRLLARAFAATGDEAAKASFEKGMQFVLTMQYPNGGFPQRFPLQKNYGRHITYNDGAMVGVMRLLRDAAKGEGAFAFVPAAEREKYQAAYDKGIECILATQIVQDGQLTVWCQQHDEVTLKPASARSYELPSLCSAESADITMLLMEVETPSDRVKKAVEGAVNWFEKTRIKGKYYSRLRGPAYEKGYDRQVTDDATSPGIWPRFSELGTNKPLFVDRDGSIKADVKDVSYERRTGYAWYTIQPSKVLNAYPQWKMRVK